MNQPKVPGSRKPHRKTRYGCVDCKRRRIKCDQSKPSCNNCKRQSLECTYLPTRLKSSKPQVDADSEVSTPHSLPSPVTSLPLLPPLPSQGVFEWKWEAQDLELLHFYTTVTSLSFSNTAERQRIWQFIVPQMAFSHDFLLHFILAFAGLHLSRLQPERKKMLRDSATKHYNTASTSFRHAISNITPENSSACFACSTFVLTYSWASSDNTGALFFVDASVEESGKESTVEWVRLLRGVHSLLEFYWHWVRAGPLGPLLDLGKFEEPPPTEATVEYTEKLDSLKQLWDPERPSKTSAARFTDLEVEVLIKTLELLKSTYGIIVYDGEAVDVVGVIYSWPIRVPESFIQMVNQRRPEALILLAHYCLLLSKVDHLWWIQGMSRHLLQTIHKALGKEWESWIAWPLQDLVLSEFRNSGKDESHYGLPVHDDQEVSS